MEAGLGSQIPSWRAGGVCREWRLLQREWARMLIEKQWGRGWKGGAFEVSERQAVRIASNLLGVLIHLFRGRGGSSIKRLLEKDEAGVDVQQGSYQSDQVRTGSELVPWWPWWVAKRWEV